MSLSTMKKLHARSSGPYKVIRKIGSNAYVLEIPPELGISSTFNVSDLIEYREPTLIPSEPFGPNPVLESEPTQVCPPAIPPARRDKIERILDDKIIATWSKDYQRYLVRW